MLASRRLSAAAGLLLALRLSLAWAGEPQGAAAGDSTARKQDVDSAKLARISHLMRQFVEDKQVAGVVTLVARRGQVVHLEAVGSADLEHEVPMQTDSMFAIASMTKPITATAVMILQDEGKLSIDDPVSKYIPQFKEAALASGSPTRPITLRDLLTHTSGLGGDQKNQGTLKETVEAFAQRPLDFEPGSKWQYSPGLSVCGRVVEVVSGQPLDQFLEERIFQPLKMVDTTFNPSPEQRKRVAHLYKLSQDKKLLEPASHWISDTDSPRTPNPSGGLFSTASDLGRFYQMVLNGGELDGRRILSKTAVEQMTSVQTGDLATGFTPGNGWGLGWCVVREPQGVTKVLSPGTFGHGGALGTQGWVDPKRQMIFVLLIQRSDIGNSDGSELRSALQETAIDAVRE